MSTSGMSVSMSARKLPLGRGQAAAAWFEMVLICRFFLEGGKYSSSRLRLRCGRSPTYIYIHTEYSE